MDMLLGILIGELILLFFLSRSLTQSLYHLFLLIFRAKSVAISLLLILEFPGTVVHELAHLFTAEILRVPTGKLTLVPESIREAQIRSGSVMIAESDPFRRYAIGLAPIFWGMIVLTALSYLLTLSTTYDLLSILYFYLLFAVSNSMFSSPEDLKGFGPFAAVVALFLAGAYFLGVRFALTGQAIDVATRTLTTLTNSLTIVILINIGFLVVSRLLMRLLLRLFHLRAH